MKKLLSVLALVSLGTGAAFAALIPNQLTFSAVDSTSGGATITANMSVSTGNKVVVYGIYGKSDLSTSVLQLQEADTSGVTTNYTTIKRFSVGSSADLNLNNGAAPVFVGKKSYAYRLLLDSTTANSLIVLYQYE